MHKADEGGLKASTVLREGKACISFNEMYFVMDNRSTYSTEADGRIMDGLTTVLTDGRIMDRPTVTDGRIMYGPTVQKQMVG